MFQALGVACTDAEWSANPDACERRNLDDYYTANPVGGGVTVGVVGAAGPAPRTAADLKALVQKNGGALYVWSANVSQSPELNIVKANPLTFTATPVAGDPGTYKVAVMPSLLRADPGSTPNRLTAPAAFNPSASALTGYLPYVLLAGGALVVLSMLKK